MAFPDSKTAAQFGDKPTVKPKKSKKGSLKGLRAAAFRNAVNRGAQSGGDQPYSPPLVNE